MQRIGVLISGAPGSGSTTLSNNLAKKFACPKPYYAGGVVRWLFKLMDAHGLEVVKQMPPSELLHAIERGEAAEGFDIAKRYGDFPPELDLLVDKVQEQILEGKDFGVHEGRIVWFFAKQLQMQGRALDKIFVSIVCHVDSKVGAERLLRRPENFGKSLDGMAEETADRINRERERYRMLYGIQDYLAPSHFDIQVDTSNRSAEEVCVATVEEIMRFCPSLSHI